MKVLLLHPYGETLTDWNHRIKRQVELMATRCELKVFGIYGDVESILKKKFDVSIKKEIDNFKPDVLYVSGFLIADICLRFFNKIVFDMGAYKTRNTLFDTKELTYHELRKMTNKEILNYISARELTLFEKEDKVIRSVSQIIIWEGDEAMLVKKIHEVENINEVSMIFYEVPKPIKWEDKKDRVLAVAAKWGDRAKNGRLLQHVNLNMKDAKYDDKYLVKTIGRSGDNNITSFLPHKTLMDEINDSKVIFCPYLCGGIGVINEALKLGCNVIVGDWHPYLKYVSNEIMIKIDVKSIPSNAVEMIKKSMSMHYEPKNKMPTEEEQINKVMLILEKVAYGK